MAANTNDPLLVVSHPCVVPENQEVYLELHTRGWPLILVTPARWSHAYRTGSFTPTALAGLEDCLQPMPVALSPHAQRHLYLLRTRAFVRRIRPAVAFLEQEPFALSALQWGRALARLRIPFGVQMDENLDRVMPPAVRTARRWVLEHAAFVAARSPDAAALAERWGATGEVAVVPHAVPAWGPEPARPGRDTFTIGFAGRLVEEKGILDLTAAVGQMRAAKRLLVVGSGPLAPRLRELQREGAPIELREGVSHGEMPAIFAEMDVLVLPSRTTPDWAEQFGRVIVEALWSGVPVVGSDSGAIPWVLETTGGGKVFPEGDVGRLAAALDELASDPAVRRRLAETGGRVARERFGRAAAASALEQVLHKLGHEQPRSHEHPG